MFFICSGLTAVLNAKLLPAAVTHLSSVTIACIELKSPLGKLLPTTGSRTLAIGHRQYGRPSLAIAGLLVYIRDFSEPTFMPGQGSEFFLVWQ